MSVACTRVHDLVTKVQALLGPPGTRAHDLVNRVQKATLYRDA